MTKSGLAEKYERIVQDMYDDSTSAVRCAVGVTERFEVKVGLHQGSALSPCLFAMVMDRMTDEIREEAPWTMMFDIENARRRSCESGGFQIPGLNCTK